VSQRPEHRGGVGYGKCHLSASERARGGPACAVATDHQPGHTLLDDLDRSRSAALAGLARASTVYAKPSYRAGTSKYDQVSRGNDRKELNGHVYGRHEPRFDTEFAANQSSSPVPAADSLVSSFDGTPRKHLALLRKNRARATEPNGSRTRDSAPPAATLDAPRTASSRPAATTSSRLARVSLRHGEEDDEYDVECKTEEEPVPSRTDVCDKCDSREHPTDRCPHFRKPRDKHADAQRRRPAPGAGDGKIVYLTNARVVTMPGDGNCLFHSLSYGLRSGVNARQLRRQIAEFIGRNPKLEIAETPLKDWVKWDSGRSVSEYAQRMAMGGWGGGIECAACSRLMGVNVHIYERTRRSRFSRGGANCAYKRISCFDLPGPDGRKAKTVSVLYCGGVHYNALDL